MVNHVTPDEALMAAMAAGDQDAAAVFVRRHQQRVFGLARSIVSDPAAAEDVAQEAFLAAVRALDRFDRRRPFGPWLHRIVVNRAIDWARARTLRGEVAADESFAAEPHEDLPGVVRALAELPPDQRAVIALRYLLEYTPGEIAELLDLPRGTVNSRLRRGLDALKSDESIQGA